MLKKRKRLAPPRAVILRPLAEPLFDMDNKVMVLTFVKQKNTRAPSAQAQNAAKITLGTM